MDLKAIQNALTEAKLDGWLFYDHHRRDAIAYRVLNVNPAMITRRWYYLVPARGEASKLVHRIENGNLSALPGATREYSTWNEQREGLRQMLDTLRNGSQRAPRVAMQYSPLNDIPSIGLVDAGTVELVESFGIEVVSSGDLVQLFEARWSPPQLESHLEAGRGVHAAVRRGFEAIREAIEAGRRIGEFDVQQEMVRVFEERGLEADSAPDVAVNAHCSDPHYSVTPATSQVIRRGDFVLLDVFGKCRRPGAVYFDITWTGYVGAEVPARHAEIFSVVREARDAAISLVQRAMRQGQVLAGCEVDDAARQVIARHGYAEYFVHRTGHSIGEDIHGNGANIDNFETHDARLIIPRTCFSIEPGIYLAEFGVRSEVNVYVEERDARVTGEIQQAVVPILGAAATSASTATG